MLKLVKRLGCAVVILVLLVIVGAVLAVGPIAAGLIRPAVEKGATYALGVDTKLAGARVGLTSGEVGLSGLAVSNPAGFSGEKFLYLGDGGVTGVSWRKLSGPVIEVPSLKFETIRVSLGCKDGKTNYAAILDNLKKLESGSSKPSAASEEPKFVIRELVIRDVRVRADMLGMPAGLGVVEIPIDEVKLTNVGTAGEPVPLSTLAGIVVKAVLGAAGEKGQGIIPTDILGDLTGKLGELKGLDQLGIKMQTTLGAEAQKQLDKAKGELDKALNKAAGEATKKIDDAIKKGADKIIDAIPGKKK